MPDLAECIRLFHEAQATRPPGRPIRVIRVAMLRTKSWRQDVGFLVTQRLHKTTAAEPVACATLADLGEHLGLERVGRAAEAREVTL